MNSLHWPLQSNRQKQYSKQFICRWAKFRQVHFKIAIDALCLGHRLGQRSSIFLAWQTGGGVEGEKMVLCKQPASAHICAQLHFHELYAHALAHCLWKWSATHASGDAFACLPTVSVAWLETASGPLVSHSPEVGDPWAMQHFTKSKIIWYAISKRGKRKQKKRQKSFTSNLNIDLVKLRLYNMAVYNHSERKSGRSNSAKAFLYS